MSVGIENLKKAALVGVNFGKQIETAAEGGFKLVDLFGFMDDFTAIPGIVESKASILAEIKDLDAAERVELGNYVAQTLDLKNDRIEEIIEASVRAIIAIVELVDKFKKPAAPEAQ